MIELLVAKSNSALSNLVLLRYLPHVVALCTQGGSSTQAPGKTGLKPGILGSGCADAEGEGLLNGSSSEECELFVACTEATAA